MRRNQSLECLEMMKIKSDRSMCVCIIVFGFDWIDPRDSYSCRSVTTQHLIFYYLCDFLLVHKDIHFGWHFYNAWINDDFFHFCNFHDIRKIVLGFSFLPYSPLLLFLLFGREREREKMQITFVYKIPSIYYICERCSVFCVRNWHNILIKME